MAVRAEDIDDVTGRVDLDRDRVLVVRHQKGDTAAFDELYRRYHPRLVLFCRRRVGDPHVAEELAQEAFLKALRAMPRFGGERRFYPWMTVIAQRLCIDHHRRSARVEPASEVDTGTVEPEHDAVFDAVDREHLDEALGRLAPRHREVLELREQRGWSYHDIANHLAVPMTTVEALLHRARKALRREFLAVAEDKGASAVLPIAGLGILARIKRGLLALGPERLVPALGAAAAGVAAVGMLAGPASVGDQPPPSTTIARDAAAITTVPTSLTTAASSVPPLVTAIETSAPTTRTGSAAPTTTSSGRPEGSTSVGPVGVFETPEGQAYVDQEIESMPFVVDLGLLRVGVDPDRVLGGDVDRLGSPVSPEEDEP